MATTLAYEVLLADPRDQDPREGTPDDPKWWSSNYYFQSTGFAVVDGLTQPQRPELDLNTSPGDLTTPGDGYARMDLAGFAEAIYGQYGYTEYGIWLTTKQSEPLAVRNYSPTMEALRAYLDVEARVVDWTGDSPTLRGQVSFRGVDASTVTGYADPQPISDVATTYTFPLRNLTFDFDQSDSSRTYYESVIYTPLVNALGVGQVLSLLWPAPHGGGTVEIGWVRLRVEIDLGSPYQPPRRVYPRDDGLTGGARRTWPPSKAAQRGFRVDGSGYL